MTARTIRILFAGALLVFATAAAAEFQGDREFDASSGGTLILDLEAGGSVSITGHGGSGITVSYSVSGPSADDCSVEFVFRENADELKIITDYTDRGSSHSSTIRFDIRVPSQFDIELDSMGGSLSIDGVEGEFRGKTMGGALTLHDVRGEAQPDHDGRADPADRLRAGRQPEDHGRRGAVRERRRRRHGSSMGGNVRYKNVQRRGGQAGSPDRLSEIDEATADTVQISTMGGAIKVEEAPEGANLHTMGGEIRGRRRRALRAGQDHGRGHPHRVGGRLGQGDHDGRRHRRDRDRHRRRRRVELHAPATSRSTCPPASPWNWSWRSPTPATAGRTIASTHPSISRSCGRGEWDYDNGSPRKFIRASGSNGGANRVKIETINGNITIVEGR